MAPAVIPDPLTNTINQKHYSCRVVLKSNEDACEADHVD